MTLVLLTPIGLDGGYWERVRLADVATVKHVFPGFGGRPRAAEQPAMAGLADEIADSCEGTLDVAGVSFGGMVAQHFAVRRPPSAPRALVLDGPHMMPLERSAEFGAALSEHRRFAEAG